MTQAAPGKSARRLAIRPRLALFLLGLALIAGIARLSFDREWLDALTIGFDIAATGFVLSFLSLRNDHTREAIQRHASEFDLGTSLLPLFVGLLALALFFAIGGELAAARCADGLALAKLMLALVLAWAMLNLVFMLHYAHLHYGGDPSIAAFAFPGPDEPDYWDFLYFSVTAGMSFAASDVDVTARKARHSVVFHCLLAFLFNIGALAFTINVLAGGDCRAAQASAAKPVAGHFGPA